MTNEDHAVAVVRLSQATMVALMGIADMKTAILGYDSINIPVGHVLRMLDALQLDIIKTREGDDQ